MQGYDNWKLRTPEEEYEKQLGLIHVADCENCTCSLYEGQEVVEDIEEGLVFCDETCFDEYFRESRMRKLELTKGWN